MSLLTYSPEEVVMLVAGVPLEGVVDGTFVSVERQAPLFTSTTTTDGKIVRTYVPHDIWDITFTLMNTSPSNDFLNKLSLLDRVSRRGRFPLLIKDGMGSSLVFSTDTWIEELPFLSYGTEMSTRDWVLRSANAVVTIGGNDGETSVGEDILNTITGAIPNLL